MQDSTSVSELVCLQLPILFTLIALPRRAANIQSRILLKDDSRTMKVQSSPT